MRLDYLQRQRAWEAAQAREAPQSPSDPMEPEEDEDESIYDLPSSANAMQMSQPATQMQMAGLEDEVAEVAQKEDEELDYLLGYLPVMEETQEGKEGNLWSDDDEYDELFSELMEQEQDATGGHQSTSAREQTKAEQEGASHDQDEEMDMS